VSKIETAKSICEQLQITTGKKDKEEILKINENNNDFKAILNFLLNPFELSGLSTKKINKSVNTNSDTNIDNLFDAFDYFNNHKTGTDKDIANIQNFLLHNKNNEDFYKKIITKSLKLGVNAKTVNKIYGKQFIPTFDVQLANKYFEHNDKVEGNNFSITLKIDGQRCICIKDHGNVSLFSRQGQPITGLIDIEEEIKNYPLDNFVLDGELTLLNDNGLPSAEQYKQTLKTTRKDGEKHGIKLLTFDWLPLKDFKSQICVLPYVERRKYLDNNYIGMTNINVLPVLYQGNNTDKILKFLDKVRSEEQEGLMINLNNALYDFKRTSNLLKVKVMQECDLKIIGFEEGTGRLTGTLGRINVEYKENILGVGSGFSDSDRSYFWIHQNELIGRIISVQYFEETQDKNGNKSLRFPVFKELREIGKSVSYN